MAKSARTTAPSCYIERYITISVVCLPNTNFRFCRFELQQRRLLVADHRAIILPGLLSITSCIIEHSLYTLKNVDKRLEVDCARAYGDGLPGYYPVQDTEEDTYGRSHTLGMHGTGTEMDDIRSSTKTSKSAVSATFTCARSSSRKIHSMRSFHRSWRSSPCLTCVPMSPCHRICMLMRYGSLFALSQDVHPSFPP